MSGDSTRTGGTDDDFGRSSAAGGSRNCTDDDDVTAGGPATDGDGMSKRTDDGDGGAG